MNMSNESKVSFEERRALVTDSDSEEELSECEGVRIRITPVKLINIFATTLVMTEVIIFCSSVIVKTVLDIVS